MSYKTLLFIIVTILTLNILVMYWFLFTTSARIDKLDSRRSATASPSAQLVIDESGETIVERNVTFVGPSQTCSDCPDRIATLEDDLAALKAQVEENTSAPATATTTTTSFGAQELFVPLGNGESDSEEWANITGAATYIDSGNYQNIDKIYFEGTLSIPTGQGKVYVRLYNATDDHPVWFSEMTAETHVPNTFQSDAISLDSGNKLYQVQLKNSLGVRSIIDSARVRILLK